MYKTKSLPPVSLLLAVLALLALGAVSLRAEDVVVTGCVGAALNSCPPSCPSSLGTSTLSSTASTASNPSGAARTKTMFGIATAATWAVTPTLASGSVASPGAYKVYVSKGTTGSCPADLHVTIAATTDCVLYDTNFNAAPSGIDTPAFQQQASVNIWTPVCVITNTSLTPTITFSYASGGFSRWYMDEVWFQNIGDPCSGVAGQLGVTGPLAAGQTFVTVTGVAQGATNVTVYANQSTQIASTNHAAGFGAGNLVVATSALNQGDAITGTQTKPNGASACTSTQPPSGPLVGSGAAKMIISLGCQQNSTITGPIGTATPSPGTGTLYWLKATGTANGGSGTAPLGGYEVIPGVCWQTLTFNWATDTCWDWVNSKSLTEGNSYAILESLAIGIDSNDLDSGPYDIYIDNIMNGTNVIADFENHANNTANVNFANPNATATPSAGSFLSAPDSTKIAQNNVFSGTNACHVQFQFVDANNIRWCRLLMNQSPLIYPQLSTKQPVTVNVLVLPVGSTTGAKFNGTVSAITNSTPLYQGGSVVVGVTVTGSGSYTYQWYNNGNPVATTQTYTNTGLPFATTDGPYTVTVSDGTCSVTPVAVTLTLPLPLPIITNQPASMVVNVGNPAPLTVGAITPIDPSIAGPLAYQWESFGSSWTNTPGALSGATSLALGDFLPTAQLTDSGYYDVIVSDSYGSVTSSIVSLEVVTADVVIGSGTGLRGDYYNNASYSTGQPGPAVGFPGAPVLTRVDPTINYNWGTGSPDLLINTDYFAGRWYGQVQAPIADTYTLTARTDDGVRVWVDNTLVVDAWAAQSATDRKGTIALDSNKHNILMEYFEKAGFASAQLSWSNASGTISQSFVPVEQLFPRAAYAKPLVALTAPANGSSVTLPAPVNLSANVTTNDGMIAYVAFYTNATLLAAVTNPPYNFSWSGAPAGTYPISAQVLYNASPTGGNPSSFAQSGTNSVTVLAAALASSVTISNIVNNLNGTVTINYGGGGGTKFILVQSTGLKLTRDSWTPVKTNTATPGSFTFTPGIGITWDYAIQSK